MTDSQTFFGSEGVKADTVYAHAVITENLGYEIFVPTFGTVGDSYPYVRAYIPKTYCQVLPREEDTRMIPVTYPQEFKPEWTGSRTCPGYDIQIMTHRGERIFIYIPARTPIPLTQSRLPAYA